MVRRGVIAFDIGEIVRDQSTTKRDANFAHQTNIAKFRNSSKKLISCLYKLSPPASLKRNSNHETPQYYKTNINVSIKTAPMPTKEYAVAHVNRQIKRDNNKKEND